MKKIKIAAILILLHGIIEILGPVEALLTSINTSVDISEYMHFIVPYFQTNINLVMSTSFIYGILRLIAAVGLFKNRFWGFALSIFCSIITLTLMMFVLPAGVIDGILSGAVLVLLFTARYGKKEIVEV